MSKFEENDLPRLHIIQQLQRAKLSLFGGSEIKFRDGSTRFTSAHEAHTVIDHYLDMRPRGKEEYQVIIGASSGAFCNALQELLNNKNRQEPEININGKLGQYG